MQCHHENCNETIDHLVNDNILAHSMIAVLQKVDQDGYSFFQCEQGQEREYATYQHYHCSHQHMQENFIMCLLGHYDESLLHAIEPGGGTTRMHKIVLGSKLTCKVCQSPLTTEAYRFALTCCTPYNYVPDASQAQLAEWCCSLLHARQSAVAIIETLEPAILRTV